MIVQKSNLFEILVGLRVDIALMKQRHELNYLTLTLTRH